MSWWKPRPKEPAQRIEWCRKCGHGAAFIVGTVAEEYFRMNHRDNCKGIPL